jgi:putative tricarboxylic transport membrane protein
MREAWKWMSLLFVGLSVLVLISSLGYPYHDRLGPGPGFFPFWMAFIMGGLAFGLFLQARQTGKKGEGLQSLLPDREGLRRVFTILLSLIAVTALLDPLGFRISMLLFLFILPFGLGLRHLLGVLIFAILGSFGVFHVFYHWLKVPLPIGIWGI